MSRGLRLLAVAALVCGTVPLFGVQPAQAEQVTLPAVNYGYFYAGGVDKPEQSPAPPPNLGNETDGVAPTHLAVASKGGTEDKVSFLYFELFELPPDAVIDKAVVSLVLVPNNPPTDITYQAAPANVVACKAGDEGFAGDEGVGIANAPARQCDKFKAPAAASADGKSYSFDITGLASTWMTDANDGVAFTRSDTAPTANFQIVFDAAPTATLALSYTVPGGTDEVDPGTFIPPVVDPGFTAPPPDTGGGFAPAPQTGGFDPGTAPVQPPAVTPPVTEPTGGVPTQTTNVALTGSMRPTNVFWLAGLALIAALALISLIFGDPRVPAGQQSDTRLSRALSARQGQGGRSPLQAL